MDSLFDIITWVQMQHLSDAVVHLGELVAQMPKPEKWGVRENIAVFVAFFSGSISIFVSWLSWTTNHKNAKQLEEFKKELEKSAKEHEYKLSYHKVLAEKRLAVYQELNNLLGEIVVPKNKAEEGWVSRTVKDVEIYQVKLAEFQKNTFFLNRGIILAFYGFYGRISVLLEKMKTGEKVDISWIGPEVVMLYRSIAIDIKNLENLENWLPGE